MNEHFTEKSKNMAWKSNAPTLRPLSWLSGLMVLVLGFFLSACSISYRFNGGTMDYTMVKTIVIADVVNRAPIIYPTFAGKFTEALKDIYTSRTRLEQVRRDGDLELECTITGYDLSTASVSADNFADRTKFTITVQVKYVNRANEKESFDRSFSTHRDFDKSTPFTSVQDRLVEEMTEDIVKQIYNATVENW